MFISLKEFYFLSMFEWNTGEILKVRTKVYIKIVSNDVNVDNKTIFNCILLPRRFSFGPTGLREILIPCGNPYVVIGSIKKNY